LTSSDEILFSPVAFFPIRPGEREQTCTPGELAFPVDLLDVVVHPNGQPLATFSAAASDYFSPSACCHTLAKPVNPHATADLGLIGPFWHFTSSSNKKIIALIAERLYPMASDWSNTAGTSIA
jgi:hypothetical protein